jgi:hypothetical protein
MDKDSITGQLNIRKRRVGCQEKGFMVLNLITGKKMLTALSVLLEK